MERKNEMISRGLVGAFITAYYNGEKVTITEANQLIVEKGDGFLRFQLTALSIKLMIFKQKRFWILLHLKT